MRRPTSRAGPRPEAAEIVVTRNGRPVAKLVAATAIRGPRTLGVLKGRIRIHKDLDVPLSDDVLDAFERKA